MIEIVYIIEKFPSESEHFVLNEILELEKWNFNIHILALKKPKKNVNRQVDCLKAQIIYLPNFFIYILSSDIFNDFQRKVHIYRTICLENSVDFKNLLRRTYYFFIALYYYKKISKLGVSHVHAHFAFIATDIAIILSKLIGVDYSFTAHAQDIYLNKNGIVPKIRMAKFLVTCNQHNKVLLDTITKTNSIKKNIFAIYHGIDIEKWPYTIHTIEEKDAIKILTVARLVEKKGIIYGLRAAKILVDKGYKISYTIVGEGILHKELTKYVMTNNLEKYIKLVGTKSQSDIFKLMELSNIFILPCIEAENGDMDGLPNVLLEALAVGLPVITSEISAIEELIVHRETGIVVNPKNAIELSDAIIELNSDSLLYNKLSNVGQYKVEHDFDIKVSTIKLKNIFEEFIT